MNRNTLSKRFNRLAVFTAFIPLAIVAYLFSQADAPWSAQQIALTALACLLFLCCLIVLAYIFNKKEKDFVVLIERIRKEAAQRADELNALRDISDLTSHPISADDLLKLILEKAMQVIAVRNGSVFLVDASEPDGLRLVAAKPPVVFKDDDGSKPRRYSFVKSVIESGQALRIQDIESDPRTLKANDPKYGAPSFISMPVYKNKQVVAVMNLANKENGGIFTEGDERILSIMLSAIGTGLENISLQRQVKLQQADISTLQGMLK